MFKKLAEKFNIANAKKLDIHMTQPYELRYHKNDFLEGLTKRAVEMYEKKCDINRFAKLVISDPENLSHFDIMNELFEEGVVDPYLDEKLDMLSDNRRFLRDLGLSE